MIRVGVGVERSIRSATARKEKPRAFLTGFIQGANFSPVARGGRTLCLFGEAV